ncbi:MAG: hypothetical protein QXL78_02570 [Methanocellales archaeon]
MMQMQSEKLRETLKALNFNNSILASAFLLRDGALLSYELSSKCSSSHALELLHYAARIAIEKIKNGCVDEVVIAQDDCKIFASWVNSRALLAIVTKPLADTNLILAEVKRACKEASKHLLESIEIEKEETPRVKVGTHRIARLQLSVLDTSGLPVPNCLVEVYSGKKKVQADLTTPHGMASFKLVTGEYELVVKKGCASYRERFSMDREFLARSITLKSLVENNLEYDR